MVWGDTEALSPLQVKLDQKAQEAERIRGEIEKAKLDAQLLRLQLQVHGITDGRLIPADLQTGGKPLPSDFQYLEIQRLLVWLAENCNLATKQSFLVPDPEVNVGGECVYLGHMAQWKLSVPGGLKFSVPVEFEQELIRLLRRARSSCLDDADLERFAADWVLMTTDLATDLKAPKVPALFLINKECNRACIVSSWPTMPPIVEQPPPGPKPTPFDPSAFFGASRPPQPSTIANPPLPQRAEEVSFTDEEGYVSTMTSTRSGLMWIRYYQASDTLSKIVEDVGISFDINDQFTVSGPHGPCTLRDPEPGPLQRWLVSGLVALALEHGVRVQRSNVPTFMQLQTSSAAKARSMSSGDAVEVKYEGHWLRGVLQAVHGEVAHVRCDVDKNGAITLAPLDRVRPAGFQMDATEVES